MCVCERENVYETYTHTYIHTFIHTHVCIYMYRYVQIYIYTRIHALYIYIYIYMHDIPTRYVCIHYTSTYTCIRIHTRIMQVHMIQVHIHVYEYIHENNRASSLHSPRPPPHRTRGAVILSSKSSARQHAIQPAK